MEDLPAYTDYMMYHLKMWLDTVHMQVEVKGASVWLAAKNIVITSNHTLMRCLESNKKETPYIEREDYDAVKKRIHHMWTATN